jgi:hypothetical protein
MNHMPLRLAAATLLEILAAASATSAWAQTSASMPHLIKSGAAVELEVDNKPFLLLAGELHNSSASSVTYMAPIWDKLAALNLNSVIGTVSWELTEPEPGKFDFNLVDDEIEQAHQRRLKLVLIWFGSYKNAESRYTPAWIRRDPSSYPPVVQAPDAAARFARSVYASMPRLDITPFSDPLLQADSRAFAALMRHIREVDHDHTVIMMQVENEVGILGESRDRSAAAEAAWQRPVPAELIGYLRRNETKLRPELAKLWARQGRRSSGTWAQVFGTDWQADEVFMAWQFGRFVGQVAQAGKKELPLPMYANAWLGPQPGQDMAGKYPSGGPVARMMDVWKAAAPALDFLAPDIYVEDVKGTFNDYARADNPLFAPETQPIVGSVFQAIGRVSSLGYSIFGIEDVPLDGQIAEAYRWLKPAIPQILQAQADDGVRGFALAPDEVASFKIKGWDVKVTGTLDAMKKAMLDAGMAAPEDHRASKPEGRGLRGPTLTDKRPSGMIIATGTDEFLLLGSGFSAGFSLPGAPPGSADIESIDEGSFKEGRWLPGRRLNGDERYSPIPVDGLAMVRIKLMRGH